MRALAAKRRLSIVIVDEHTADRPVFQRLAAEFSGSHVMCFPSLEAAGHQCIAHAPDIFIIDDTGANHVPRSFEPHIRERRGLLHASIVLIVAHERPLAEQSRSNGIDLCLPKPVNIRLFMATLHAAVKLRDARLAIAIERVPPIASRVILSAAHEVRVVEGQLPP
jgi:DNA-binding NarL/FixJ family response regulator